MTTRTRHEWYIANSKGDSHCRHCGITVKQDKMLEADLILRCEFPNTYQLGNVTLFFDSLTDAIQQVNDPKSPLSKVLRKIQ
jgi:hypothetical protein